MKIGILGFAQSGKKTVLQLLTHKKIEHLSPGEVAEGVAWIRDSRLDRLADKIQPEKVRHAEIDLTLVPSVEIGSGEKASWPDAARKMDALCLVIREFPSESVFHPKGAPDPQRDLELLECELILADLALVEGRLERLEKEIRTQHKPEQEKLRQALQRCRGMLEEETYLAEAAFSPEEAELLTSFQFLTMKPVLVVLNCGETVPEDISVASSRNPRIMVVPVSCEMELEIESLDTEEEKKLFLQEIGFLEPAVERLSLAALDLIGLICFFTLSKNEVRATTVRRGALAPEAAGAVHSDFERGFIRAEVIRWDELLEAGSEAKAKEQGLMMLKGKDYEVQDGDVLKIRFSV